MTERVVLAPLRTSRPEPTPPAVLALKEGKQRVAVLRTEGSNGDREMTASFHLAGFEVRPASPPF